MNVQKSPDAAAGDGRIVPRCCLDWISEEVGDEEGAARSQTLPEVVFLFHGAAQI